MMLRTCCLTLLLVSVLAFASTAQADTALPTNEVDWDIERETDPILDTMNITASLRASGEKKSFFADGKFLVLRCRESELDLYVIWGSFGSLGLSILEQGGQRVTWRFDKDKPETEPWSRSSSHNATFAPEPTEFAERIARHQRLAVRTYPRKGGSLTGVFDLSKAGPVIEEVIAACGT